MLTHDGEGAIGVVGCAVTGDIVRGDAGQGCSVCTWDVCDITGAGAIAADHVAGGCGLAVAIGHVVHCG